jgi:GNAT superfamily N-acetyltransferase
VKAAERAALEHENWIAYLTGVVRCADAARVHRDGGAVSILSEIPFDWFNQVLIERSDATSAGLLAGVEEGLGHVGGFVVRLRDGVDDRFIPTLNRIGLIAASESTTTPGMIAFPIDRDSVADALAPSRLPGFEIYRVVDAVGIDEHRNVVTEGFGSHPLVAFGTTCLELLDRPDCVVYVGYADGAPVVSGLGWRTGRTIGVYAISTIPAARRRGYGAAMTARVVTDGLAAGCDVAALQASEMGRPTYERLGFRVDVSYTAYGPRIDERLAANRDWAPREAPLATVDGARTFWSGDPCRRRRPHLVRRTNAKAVHEAPERSGDAPDESDDEAVKRVIRGPAHRCLFERETDRIAGRGGDGDANGPGDPDEDDQRHRADREQPAVCRSGGDPGESRVGAERKRPR